MPPKKSKTLPEKPEAARPAPPAEVTSDCPAFGKSCDPQNKDCAACAADYPDEYDACAKLCGLKAPDDVETKTVAEPVQESEEETPVESVPDAGVGAAEKAAPAPAGAEEVSEPQQAPTVSETTNVSTCRVTADELVAALADVLRGGVTLTVTVRKED